MQHYHVAVIGCSVSGLLLAMRLQERSYSGRIALIDGRPEESIRAMGDDVPYYFNREVAIPGLSLRRETMLLDIWYGGAIHTQATPEMAMAYAKKIVGQSSKTTLDFLKGRRDIYVPVGSETGGRRRALLNGLLTNVRDAEWHFSAPIVAVDCANHRLELTGGRFISYDQLVSTIALPVFLQLAAAPTKGDVEFVRRPFYMALASAPPTGKYRATYCPDPNVLLNRCALLNDRLFIEAPQEFHISTLASEDLRFLATLGIPKTVDSLTFEYKQINPGRFVALEPEILKRIQDALIAHGIFLLGRYGTWTFKLTEDVWDDTEVIASMICQSL